MSTRTYFPLLPCFLLVLSLSLSCASCTQATPTPKAPSYTLGTVQTWIGHHVIPFKTDEPSSLDEDLQPLKQLVGNATIVGLGEQTHGTHEFFTMKRRILEFLVTHMGFTTFALENGWDESRVIDQYVLTGQGNLVDLLHDDLYTTWQVQEFRDLIEWIRAYDAERAHPMKVHFAGIDCGNISQAAFDEVTTYVHSVDPQQAGQIQALYTDIRPTNPTPVFAENFSALPQTIKEQQRDNAQKVYLFLQAHQAAYESQSSKEAFALALQSAHVILQYTKYVTLLAPSHTPFSSPSGPGYIYRDTCMAENVAWLHEHAAGSARMVLSAHNAHIANTTPFAGFGEHNLGGFLRQQYKQQYLTIGTSFFQGSFNALTQQNGLTSYTVGPPPVGSYDYVLGSVGLALYLLDIRQTPTGSVTNWVQGPAKLRRIGQFFDPAHEAQYYDEGSLQQWFDAIIHFQQTTASRTLS
jgi:erythromycin esterase